MARPPPLGNPLLCSPHALTLPSFNLGRTGNPGVLPLSAPPAPWPPQPAGSRHPKLACARGAAGPAESAPLPQPDPRRARLSLTVPRPRPAWRRRSCPPALCVMTPAPNAEAARGRRVQPRAERGGAAGTGSRPGASRAQPPSPAGRAGRAGRAGGAGRAGTARRAAAGGMLSRAGV